MMFEECHLSFEDELEVDRPKVRAIQQDNSARDISDLKAEMAITKKDFSEVLPLLRGARQSNRSRSPSPARSSRPLYCFKCSESRHLIEIALTLLVIDLLRLGGMCRTLL